MHTLKFEYVSIPFSMCNVKLKRNLNELSDFVKAFNPPSERFLNAPLLIQLYNMCLLKKGHFFSYNWCLFHSPGKIFTPPYVLIFVQYIFLYQSLWQNWFHNLFSEGKDQFSVDFSLNVNIFFIQANFTASEEVNMHELCINLCKTCWWWSIRNI